MKDYPKIEYYNEKYLGLETIFFDKLDGNNFRAEYSKKRGFYKFGTRTEMIDINHEQFGKIIPLFLEKYNEDLSKIFTDKYKKVENFVVFGEYVGENSFAGVHKSTDKMDVVLFDINQYKKGFISPWEFVDNFGKLNIAKIIYKGKYTEEMIENIRNNVFNLKEGVIAKGIYKTKKEGEIVFRNKIKTLDWLKKIKNEFGDKFLLDELNGDKKLFLNI